MIDIIIVISFSYIFGSIPFGLILTKIFGNILLAAITLFLDVLKGYVPVIISLKYFPELTQLSCIMTFLGHVFPIWLKFKGGKGVATYLGILFAISLELSFLFIFTWLVVALIFKYSSLSSMFSSLTVFIVFFVKSTALKNINPNLIISEDIKLLLFIFFTLIIYTHRKNIFNLKNKTEQKIKI